MSANNFSINLLAKKENGFVDQFLNWTLTIGRLLIILTEMVALGTFLYRFSLDMQIVDLHDKIKRETLIVSNFKSSEENFRDLQDRLTTIKHYDSIGSSTFMLTRFITDLGMGKVTFKSIIVSSHEVKIEMQSSTPTPLSQFVQSLQKQPQITSITIDKIENNTARAQIIMAVTATLQRQGFADEEQQGITKPVENQPL
jgi:hypothetical protein